MEGFLLGVSSGIVCLAHCAPVLVPYFLGEGENTARNVFRLFEFLLGRLAGYVLFGVLAWAIGQVFLNSSEYSGLFFGVIYVVLAVAMALYGLFIAREKCALKSMSGAVNRLVTKHKWIVAALLGFLTGINFCPPFLLAFSSSAQMNSLSQSVLFFVAFFAGTSLYFIPTVMLGFLNVYRKLAMIGKMTAVVMSVYFLYRGSVMIAEGVIAL